MSSATPPLCVQVTGSVNIPPLPTAAKASIAAELVSGVAIASQSGPASIVEDSRVPTPPAEVRSSVLEDEIRALKSKVLAAHC